MRIDELTNIKYENVDDLPHKRTYHVLITNTKNHVDKSFTIKDEFYDTVKKYISLRPPHTTTERLFLRYENGKCTNQHVGKHKFAAFPRAIAEFLGLPDPENYTGNNYTTFYKLLINNEIPMK